MAVILAGWPWRLSSIGGNFLRAMVVGALLFQVVFQTNQLLLAFAFLLVGLPPLYGLTLFYGALVLRLKETDAFIQIAQWISSVLVGVYFPVSLLPLALRIVSWLFRPPGSPTACAARCWACLTCQTIG